jgi:thioesterase domain-containing protein/acyl carrier protein
MLEHLGRLDSRVKVRGAMVATSEVEIALMSLDGVADAAVISVPDDAGSARLVAYVVGDGQAPLSAWKLRRDVATRVPTTMLPSAFVAVETLPRTVRHKIDRSALPPPPTGPERPPYRQPRGSEADLAAIFANVLGVERVGLDDDFFELGGDSLAVLELIALVVERFSVDLATSVVLEAPTVADLALRLSHRRTRDASPAVGLRTDAPGDPFFCVTGGGAPAISLRALSEAMPGHNFFAIQARGLEERARPDHSVAAAARRNILAMRTVQTTGPYAIGGYSFGALVAFEMACRLRSVGEDVALLVLLDTAAPIDGRKIANRARARVHALRADAPNPRLARSAFVARRAARFGIKSAYAHAERRVSLTSAGLFPRRGYHQYDLFLRLHTRMAYEYRPSHAFDGPVLVIGGDDLADFEPTGLDQPRPHDLGWSRLVTGPLTTVRVPADHHELMRAPAVAKVAAYLDDALHS